MMAAGARSVSESEPERVLDLLDQLGPSSGPAPVLGAHLGRLVRAFPSRTIRLLLRSEHLDGLRRTGLPRGVLVNARVVPVADLNAIATTIHANPTHLVALLGRLAPSERAALFAAAYAGIDTSRSVWPDALLEVLPTETSERDHADARTPRGCRGSGQDDGDDRLLEHR